MNLKNDSSSESFMPLKDYSERRSTSRAMMLFSTLCILILSLSLFASSEKMEKTPQSSNSEDENKPSRIFQPYFGKTKFQKSQAGEDMIALKYFSKNNFSLAKGTYFEIGANDGITFSNSYFFEHELNWTGILVEAFPDSVKLVRENRRSETNKIIGKAVCPDGQKSVQFYAAADVGSIANDSDDELKEQHQAWTKNSEKIEIDCNF